jgi:hypothetical protein
MLRANLSVLSQSCVAQKAGGLPIPGKPRSSHATSPWFARPKTDMCGPAIVAQVSNSSPIPIGFLKLPSQPAWTRVSFLQQGFPRVAEPFVA